MCNHEFERSPFHHWLECKFCGATMTDKEVAHYEAVQTQQEQDLLTQLYHDRQRIPGYLHGREIRDERGNVLMAMKGEMPRELSARLKFVYEQIAENFCAGCDQRTVVRFSGLCPECYSKLAAQLNALEPDLD